MKQRGFLNVKKHEDAILPRRSTENAAGYDLFAQEDYIIPSIPKMLIGFVNLESSINDKASETMDDMDQESEDFKYIKSLLDEVDEEVQLEVMKNPGQVFVTDPIVHRELDQKIFKITSLVMETRNIDLQQLYEYFVTRFKPILVSTGVKAYMQEDECLQIYNRSSNPKKGLIVANGVGLVDSDYFDNEDNEGLIFVPFINYSSVDVIIKKGDRIAQGVFSKFLKTDDDDLVEKNVRNGGFGSTGVK